MTTPCAVKPNCYECKHRRDLAGSAHSCCKHPDSGLGDDPLSELFSILGKRMIPRPTIGGQKLNVSGNPHGIKHGWFLYPYNYDPIWLLSCNGFEPKGGELSETTVPSASESAIGEVPVRNANEASGCIANTTTTSK